MIRNIVAYPLPRGWPHLAHETAALLSRREFQGCGALDTAHAGFVPPRDDAALCEAIAGRYLFCHQHEEKILPASVVNEYVEIKCEEIEQQQGYKLGRKQRTMVKEEVVTELLPQAFTKKRRTLAWINSERGWLIIEATSTKRAEDVLEDMRHALDTVPAGLLSTEVNPARAMLRWLADQEAPDRFTIDSDCELVSFAEDEGVVRYTNWDLAGEDIQHQISIGRAPTLLGLTFDDRVSFIMTNRLELKRILLLDIVTAGQEEADDAIAKFDADFTLVAAEIEGVLEALVDELGGLAKKGDPDLVDMGNGGAEPGRSTGDLRREVRSAFEKLAEGVAAHGGSMTISTGDDQVIVGVGNDLDPLYHDAKRIVIEQGRPSISLVQRHLRIGYNRAARLIEQMETDGLVSAMRADGTREVLAA
ncbi:recombination-associated protein RdgC [Thauera aromatica]|uniref:Recombination-associated protein RdgC n=1 Tax=Thauera aromatica K172 TaxID=44139 RepID=A0A2R4BNX4_THAAR|nr:recombination-associated protein RdgC [Thauera aromatica]AVR89047.1 Cell division protein FtsK [Thauera aromatica K172]